MKFDLLRMMRLEGHKPTAREMWGAFYRLWRLSRKNDLWSDTSADDAWRVLGFYEELNLCNQDLSTLSRVSYPTVIRRKLLGLDRRRNAHGQHFELLEESRRVAAMLREQGIEMTPDEVGISRKEIFAKIRRHFEEKGAALPLDDVALLRYLRRLKGMSA